MPIIKTADLTGPALDWAVAKCEGFMFQAGGFYKPATKALAAWRLGPWHPSTDWSQGGPIMDRANITTIRANDDYEVDAKGFTTSKRIPQWFAECDRWTGHGLTTSYEGEHMEPTFMIGEEGGYYGTTPLIAAMRCYVASKLGDEVDVPAELSTCSTGRAA